MLKKLRPFAEFGSHSFAGREGNGGIASTHSEHRR